MTTRADAHKPEMHRDASWKYPVRASSTSNSTYASSFANGQPLDGLTLATGDRILLKDQTTGSQNGIHVVGAGTPSRAYDMDTGLETVGSIVHVISGTINAGKVFRNTNTGSVTVGSTALTFAELGASVSFGSNANSVGSANAGGASPLAIRADHVHQGVHKLTSNGSNALYEDVNLQAGSGIALGVSGQTITFTNTGSSSSSSGVGGYEDLALWMAYTLDKNPSGSYPDKNYAKNGTSQAGILTAAGPPRFNGDTFGGNMSLGWQRDVQLSPDIFVLVNVDFGADVMIGIGRAHGITAIGGSNVKHPSAFEVFYSDNGSSYSTFGTALSGMGEDPGSLTTTHWVCEVAATAVSHRYWRFKISAHSGGSDCFLFVSRIQLLGTR